MPLFDLLESRIRLIFFGGKGGAGKTTCAAATGVYAAKHGINTLVFSVDPAHSLSDIFDQKIGNRITGISDNLSAIEIDARQLLEDLKDRYREVISEALKRILHGVDLPFEREIAQSIMDLSPPGLDELMALSKLMTTVKADGCQLVVVDTAAGAHAIRLMELPQIMEDWIQRAIRIQDRLEEVMPMEELSTLLEKLRDDIAETRRTLADITKTHFVVVTIPEAMGTYVTEDLVKSLRSCGIPCKKIVVNYVIPPDLKCNYCSLRKSWQLERVKEVHDLFPGYDIVEVPLFDKHVKGKPSLQSFAEVLFEEQRAAEPRHTPIELTEPRLPEFGKTPKLDLSNRNLRLILFGGKGGCGKTTCSAATGIHMAKQGKRTLVISTDPQRSLSDCFDITMGDSITQIKGVEHLYALELDTEKLLQEFKTQHGENILDIVADATYLEKRELADFLSLSLPGMDEVMALLRLMSLIEEAEYDLYILDTAPTGHTLRFLELPDKMSDWVKLLVKMRAKTQYVVQRFFGRGLREKADVFLEKMMNDIKGVKNALKDRATEFVAVTTLDKMAIEETARLVSTLKSRQIPVRQIACNSIVPSNPGCPYCRSKNKTREKLFLELRERFSDTRIVGMPLFPHEIRGIDRLTTFATALFQES